MTTINAAMELTIDAVFAVPCGALSGRPCECEICWNQRWHAEQAAKRASRLAWERCPDRLAEIEQMRAEQAIESARRQAAWLAEFWARNPNYVPDSSEVALIAARPARSVAA